MLRFWTVVITSKRSKINKCAYYQWMVKLIDINDSTQNEKKSNSYLVVSYKKLNRIAVFTILATILLYSNSSHTVTVCFYSMLSNT